MLGPLALILLAPSAAFAGDVVSEETTHPFPGIDVVTRIEENPSNRIYAAYVSLCEPHVHVIARTPPTGLRTPGGWGDELGVQLATNGDFFKTDPVRVYGDAVGNGIPWPFENTGKSAEGEWYYQDYGWIAFGDSWVEFNHTKQTKTADAEKFGVHQGFHPTELTEALPEGTQSLVSGFPELVIEGQVYTCSSPTADDCFPDRTDMRARHPRTAMGMTEDRRTFILVAVDGRDEPASVGMYGSELATLMKDLGAWQAFNLDGGGSTAMWMEGAGYLNTPSDGTPRLVANLWGVYAGAASGQPEKPGSCFEPGGCYPVPLAGAESEVFKDLPATAPGHDAVSSLYDGGIVEACASSPDLYYCPSCDITRAGFVSMLVRALGLDTSTPPAVATFADVPTDSPYFAEIEAAAAAGFTFECEAGSFCPNDALTRAEAAAFVRTAMDWSAESPAAPTYSDVAATDAAYGDVEALVAHCASEACDAGGFCPADALDRAQAAVFVAGALEGCGSNGSGGGGAGGSPSSSGGGSTDGGSSADGNATDGGGDGCSCRVDGRDRGGVAALAAIAALVTMARRRKR
ncbi:MAG: phosphodiester glycosidase family protein [Polyangiaceae bacterium]|nr:phosphodiester glycosidase family protein [Polyangiaceae bacterium]